MKKKLFLSGTLLFIFTLLSLPLVGTLGAVTVDFFPCIVNTVASLEQDSNSIPGVPRVVVSCATPPGVLLSSFAIEIGTTATTAANANRYLVLLNTAMALGKTVTIFFDINQGDNPAGCQADCRRITGLRLGP